MKVRLNPLMLDKFKHKIDLMLSNSDPDVFKESIEFHKKFLNFKHVESISTIMRYSPESKYYYFSYFKQKQHFIISIEKYFFKEVE